MKQSIASVIDSRTHRQLERKSHLYTFNSHGGKKVVCAELHFLAFQCSFSCRNLENGNVFKIFAVHVVFLLLLSDIVIPCSRNYRYFDMQISMF